MDIKKREVSFDLIRLLAIALVLLCHIIAMGIFTIDTSIANMILLDSFFHLGVPLFFMLSGAFSLKSYIPRREFYKKKISKFIVPFVFWNIFYMCLFEVSNVTEYFMFDDFSFRKLFNFVYISIYPWYHLWFLNCLFILYFLSPFLSRLVRNEKFKKFFMGFVVLYVVLDFLQINILNIHFYFSLSYLMYFILGYYLANMNLKCYRVGLLALFVCVFYFLFSVKNSLEQFYLEYGFREFAAYYLSYARWYFIILSSLFFAIMLSFNWEKILRLKGEKVILALASLTFGVYLVHPLFIQVLRILTDKYGEFPGIVVLSVVFVGSFLFTFMVKKIK